MGDYIVGYAFPSMSVLSWETQRAVYDELEKIHPHAATDHGPWDLLAPSRLIYPAYTHARMTGKSAAAKRWRG